MIRGVKLEFSSDALSPSADFFLFRPPEKQAVSVHLWLGRYCDVPALSAAGGRQAGGET